MRKFRDTKSKNYCPSMNIDEIKNFMEKSNSCDAEVIDITRWGFFKLLGKGKLPKKPIIIKAKIFSKKAQTKIVKAGGLCILVP